VPTCDGVLLSEAFRNHGSLPAIYVTSIMAGEKSGSAGRGAGLASSAYQKLSLSVKQEWGAGR